MITYKQHTRIKAEAGTMFRLLETIKHDLTVGELNPEELLHSVETILNRINPQPSRPTPSTCSVKELKPMATRLAKATADAYSYDAYTPKGWVACCLMLLKRGYDARQVEAIMRSKWTRWAGDASSGTYGNYTSADLERFLDKADNYCTLAEVDKLVKGTF